MMTVAELRTALEQFPDAAEVDLVVTDQWSSEVEDNAGALHLTDYGEYGWGVTIRGVRAGSQ